MLMLFPPCVLIVGGMMNVIDLEKPSLEELTHYGVKGMRWGHHKRPDTVEITNARLAEAKEKENFKKAKKLYKKTNGLWFVGCN